MSIRALERIAHIDSRKELAAYSDRVSRTYIEGYMSTAQYLEYQRYLYRAESHLAARR